MRKEGGGGGQLALSVCPCCEFASKKLQMLVQELKLQKLYFIILFFYLCRMFVPGMAIAFAVQYYSWLLFF